MAAAGYSGRAIARKLGCSHSYISRILAANPPEPLPPVTIDTDADGAVTLRTTGDAAVLRAALHRALSQSGITISEADREHDCHAPGLDGLRDEAGRAPAANGPGGIRPPPTPPGEEESGSAHTAEPAVAAVLSPPGRRPRLGGHRLKVVTLLGGVALGAVLVVSLFSQRGHEVEHVAADGSPPLAEVVVTRLALPQSVQLAPTPTVAAAARVAPPEPTASPVVPGGGATLTLLPRTDIDVRVSVDGVLVFAGTLPANQAASWGGSTKVEVWTDGARDLLVTVNGYELGALSMAVGHPEWNTVDWAWSADWTP